MLTRGQQAISFLFAAVTSALFNAWAGLFVMEVGWVASLALAIDLAVIAGLVALRWYGAAMGVLVGGIFFVCSWLWVIANGLMRIAQ